MTLAFGALERGPRENWNRLFDFALGQDGHFTTKQAAAAGYSPQLLIKYIKSGRIIRVMRGVYRVVHFPAGEHEELTTLWLWAECAGVFSHETALYLQQLSDVLPRQVHLTLPVDWARRRLRIPRHAENNPRWCRSTFRRTPSSSTCCNRRRPGSSCPACGSRPDRRNQCWGRPRLRLRLRRP